MRHSLGGVTAGSLVTISSRRDPGKTGNNDRAWADTRRKACQILAAAYLSQRDFPKAALAYAAMDAKSQEAGK